MNIGDATIFRQLAFGTTAATYDITPAGDPPGLYWGCIVPRFVSFDDDTPEPKSISLRVEVGGTVAFSTRLINRQQWRPYQAYQHWEVLPFSGDMDLIWRNATLTTVSSPSGTLFGSVADANYPGTKPANAPKRSYMHAYFQPAEQGPQTAALAFTVGTTPNTPTGAYACHGEPVTFWVDRQPGQSIIVRANVYRETPTAALAQPINDDLPGDKIGAEPDEVLEAQSAAVLAWLVRVGPTGETVEALTTYRTATVDPE